MLTKGKKVIFVSYDDIVYGEKYGGKEAIILESHHDFSNGTYSEFLVEFDDGCKVTVLEDELVCVADA